MPTTLADLSRALSRPAPEEPEYPAWLVEPLARHDCGMCDCTTDDHCTAALWSECCITTEEAKERLGL